MSRGAPDEEPCFFPIEECVGVDVVPVVEVLVEVELPVLVVELGVHDSDTEATPTLTGSGIEETGVPGGTLTVNVNVWPVTVLTVITQESLLLAPAAPAAAPNVKAAHTPPIRGSSLYTKRAIECEIFLITASA